MQINGGIRFCEQGMKASIRAMHLQSEILGVINENVAGFDKVGFQRREPIVSSFSEYIGVHALSKSIDDQPGRITASKNPLDISMANKGYFQIQTPEGIKLTRGLYKVIENRKEAIEFAMRIAWKNDTVILAGKGHETYQELAKGKKIHLDEREIVKKAALKMPGKDEIKY